MQTLNFRRWFENLDDPIGVQNPQAMAKHWQDNLPTEAENAPLNKEAIATFAKYMAEPYTNGEALADHLLGLEVNELRYPDKPISNNLLNVSDERLQDARGFITNQEDPEFRFFMGGSRMGSLIIQHMPVVYTQQDEILVESIIRHEVGHAADWLDPNYRYVPPSGRYKWNATAYAENIHEARRYADQLHYLIRKTGDVNKVMQMLDGPSSFRLAPALVPVAKAFLKEYGLKTENWASTLATPLMMAGSFLGGDKAEPPTQPTAIVVNQQNQFAKQAAAVVNKIISMMSLGKFVYQA